MSDRASVEHCVCFFDLLVNLEEFEVESSAKSSVSGVEGLGWSNLLFSFVSGGVTFVGDLFAVWCFAKVPACAGGSI